jgi:hypothetical protein
MQFELWTQARMDGEWSFLEAQVEQVDLVGGGVMR